MTTAKHDHHTTPRYYLKAFGIPTEPAFIWQYQRGKPYHPGTRGDRHNPVKRPLKKAGVITDYYGPYEDHLAQREAAATPIIEKLRTTQSQGARLTASEKKQLTDYIACSSSAPPQAKNAPPRSGPTSSKISDRTSNAS